MGKEVSQKKKIVSSNLPASSVNGKKTTHVFFAIQQVHSEKNHLGPRLIFKFKETSLSSFFKL